jgi:hypothetical protein
MELIVRTSASLRRGFTRLKRRRSGLRLMLPLGVAEHAMQAMAMARHLRPYYVRVLNRSRYDNVFHCCVQKTGSQWLKSLLTDVRTYQHSGLLHHVWPPLSERATWQRLPLDRRSVPDAFPTRRIVGPLYISYDGFIAAPKHGAWRAFFVLRDPRDLLVSYYFSARYSHVLHNDPTRPLFQARQALANVSDEEGLIYMIRFAGERGLFATLRSWTKALADDRVLLVRFEDLVGKGSHTAFRQLFTFLDISMPDPVLSDVLEAYSFRRLSGRSRNQVVSKSHLRGGSAGDWRTYFTPAVEAEFKAATDDLVEILGYEHT